MTDATYAFESLLPIFAYFFIGLGLRRSGIANLEHAGFLFRILFLVTLPALVFMSVSRANLGPTTVYLPLSGFLVNLSCAAVAALIARWRGLPAASAGAVVISVSIMNMSYMFPFVLASLGEDALASAILFDAGNAIFVALLAYPIAEYYGHRRARFSLASLRRIMLSPIFLAIVAALVVNLAGIEQATLVAATLTPLGNATIPLMLIAVGMSFGGFVARVGETILAVTLRMLPGGLLGLFLVWLFGFEGVTAAVLVVSAAAPVGASAAAIAAAADLDKDIAVNAISLSALVGLITSSLLLIVAAQLFV